MILLILPNQQLFAFADRRVNFLKGLATNDRLIAQGVLCDEHLGIKTCTEVWDLF